MNGRMNEWTNEWMGELMKTEFEGLRLWLRLQAGDAIKWNIKWKKKKQNERTQTLDLYHTETEQFASSTAQCFM